MWAKHCVPATSQTCYGGDIIDNSRATRACHALMASRSCSALQYTATSELMPKQSPHRFSQNSIQCFLMLHRTALRPVYLRPECVRIFLYTFCLRLDRVTLSEAPPLSLHFVCLPSPYTLCAPPLSILPFCPQSLMKMGRRAWVQ